jgi:radical SAM superfamily enzyme YgiQ (UPF0313 family)
LREVSGELLALQKQTKGTMKVSFIYPRFEKFLESIPNLDLELVNHFLGNYTTPPSLGIPILAALTPPEWDVELIDDNNGDPIEFGADTDLVAINCFTPQATRAFEIADGYRAAGKKVVMGGFFPSAMPEEVGKHADAVNIGEGETTWHQILEDVEGDVLKLLYKGKCNLDLSKMVKPRRDLFYEKKGYDWAADLVQTCRGCIYNCGMCAIPGIQGHRIRFRPIEHIVEEVRGLRFKQVYLAEDVLFFPNRRIREWSERLFDALTPLGKHFFVSSTMALNTSDDFLDLLARAGIKSFYCTMNVDPKSIRAIGGDQGAQGELVSLVKRIEERGICFFASFGIGRDWDDEGIVDSILDLSEKAGIRTAEFFIFTPYPASPQWERLVRQDRILHRDWRKYNGAHVVWKPLGFEPDRLYDSFVRLWNAFYRGTSWENTVQNLEPDQSASHMRDRRDKINLSQVNGR